MLTLAQRTERNSKAIYEHPDGATIKVDAEQLLMTASSGATTVYIDIGQLGMLELGRALIRIGLGQQEGE